MNRLYEPTKGDFCLQSKHADESFLHIDEVGWVMFWYDTPTKGKCLSVDYAPGNWPSVLVVVRANWKARKEVNRLRRSPSYCEGYI